MAGQTGQTWTKEFPPGSGVIAEYNEDELRLMAGFREQLDGGVIPPSAYRNQVAFIHGLKAEFGATIANAAEAPDSEIVKERAAAAASNQLGLVHADGHATERRAAIENYPRSGTQRHRVLQAIAAAADTGRTDYELEVELELLRPSPGNRRAELVRDGLVMQTQQTRPTSTGSPAIVWRVTPLGLEVLRELASEAA